MMPISACCKWSSWRMACKWMIIQKGRATLTSASRLEAVSYPRLGENIFRRAGFGLQLLAQLADEDAQIFVLLDTVASPNRVEDRTVGQHFARVLRHVHQHVEFL